MESSSSLYSAVAVIESLMSTTRSMTVFVGITLGQRCGHFRRFRIGISYGSLIRFIAEKSSFTQATWCPAGS